MEEIRFIDTMDGSIVDPVKIDEEICARFQRPCPQDTFSYYYEVIVRIGRTVCEDEQFDQARFDDITRTLETRTKDNILHFIRGKYNFRCNNNK